MNTQELAHQAVQNLGEKNSYTHQLEWGMTPEGIVNWLGLCKEDHPTQEEVDAERAILQTEWNAQDYARNRKDEYPDLAEQLDYIYHNGIAKWKSDMIKPVKDKYPKG